MAESTKPDAGVPDTLAEALSPRWLTAALQRRFPGVEVTAVAPGPVVERVSTNARFTIECAGAVPEGLSPHLCVKGYFNDAGRLARAVGETEATFYRDLAQSSGVRTLRSVYADFDPATTHGVVITEDVLVDGARFLDGTSAYSPDLAADSLGQLAKLHAAFWNDPRYAGAPWLVSRMSAMADSGQAGSRVDQIAKNLGGPIGVGVPPEAADASRLLDAFRVVARRQATVDSWCIIHGDAHVGNVFLDGAGRPCFLDWQLAHRGSWYIDVGYHLASALTVEDRRRNERDLLRHYLERLASFGVAAPSWDAAWRDISNGIIHGFFLWGITIYVNPSVTAALLERLGTAVADHDAFAAVG